MIYLILLSLEAAVVFRMMFMKNATSNYIVVLQLLLCVFVGCFNNQNNPDYYVYRTLYFDQFPGNYSVTEPIYVMLNRLCRGLGMSFEMFFGLQVIASLLMLLYVGMKFTENNDIVFGLFILFPFAISIIQIRFFVASSIALVAMTFLYKYQIKHNILYLVIYSGTILAAGMIHFSILSLIICLAPAFWHKRSGFFWGAICAVGMMNISLMGKYISMLIGARKFQNWMTGTETYSIAHIALVLMIRFAILVVVYMLYIFKSKRKYEFKFKFKKGFISELMNAISCEDAKSAWLFNMIVFLVLAVTPLEFFSQQFVRLSRVYIILLYIFFARAYNKKSQDNRWLIYTVMSGMMVILFYYEYSRGAASGGAFFNTVFRQVFENNLLS